MGKRSAVARALCEYVLFQLEDPRRALELAAAATVYHQYARVCILRVFIYNLGFHECMCR